MNYSSLFNSTDYNTNDISCENLTVSSTLVNAGRLTQTNVATFSDAVSFLSKVVDLLLHLLTYHSHIPH